MAQFSIQNHCAYLIELAFTPPPAKWLHIGNDCDGIPSHLLQTGYEVETRDWSFYSGSDHPQENLQYDAAICIHYLHQAEDVSAALLKVSSLVKKGGKFVFSDTVDQIVPLLSELRSAGFSIRHLEDITKDWARFCSRQRPPLPSPDKNESYVLFVCERM